MMHPGISIEWERNPLATKIHLDDDALERFKLRFTLIRLHDELFSAYFYLKGLEGADLKEHFSPERALQELKPAYELEYKDDAELIELLAKQFYFEDYLAELTGHHAGDCTCIPCTCMKCMAEDALGVNTIKGLDKQGAHRIDSLMRQGLTLSQTIDALENPTFERATTGARWTEGEFNKHLPRWTADSKKAAEWLRKYRDDHFPGE
jgi:hypothetical protein